MTLDGELKDVYHGQLRTIPVDLQLCIDLQPMDHFP